jgi:hypothetical protein
MNENSKLRARIADLEAASEAFLSAIANLPFSVYDLFGYGERDDLLRKQLGDAHNRLEELLRKPITEPLSACCSTPIKPGETCIYCGHLNDIPREEFTDYEP